MRRHLWKWSIKHPRYLQEFSLHPTTASLLLWIINWSDTNPLEFLKIFCFCSFVCTFVAMFWKAMKSPRGERPIIKKNNTKHCCGLIQTSAAPKTFKLTTAFCLSVCIGAEMRGILVIEIEVTWWKCAMCVICTINIIAF